MSLRAMKRQTLLPSLHWICIIPGLVYPLMIFLNIVSANIFFPLGKLIGMVRSRTSFILSGQSWEIGGPAAGGMGLSCVVPTSVVHIWSIQVSWGGILHLCVGAVSVFWQVATFWWSAIVLIKKEGVYSVGGGGMWWSRLDFIPHLL